MKVCLVQTWVWKMAWRESRSSWRRLLLFLCSIVLGVAALVAINSFGRNLQEAVNKQAKSLLGADLVIRSRQPFSEEAETLISSIGGEHSRETRFSSMVYFTGSNDMRLAQIRALEGHFPYYGTLETVPTEASHNFTNGAFALVDDRLLWQFNAGVGDTVKIGKVNFIVAGRLLHIPGEALAAGFIEPRVYIPASYLEQTGLIQLGSRVSYRRYFKLDPQVDVEQLNSDLEPRLDALRLRSDTVEERKARLGRSMENLYRFLNLVAFIALLLGGIGVASAIHIHIKQRLATVATLRCVGAKSNQAFAIYLIQAMAMGLIGATAGALLGIAIQRTIPKIVNEFVPVAIPLSTSWSAVVQGIVLGVGVVLLFALLPLLAVRKISPLLVLRFSYEEKDTSTPDSLQWIIYGLIVLGICSFSILQTERWTYGLSFSGGVIVVFLFLLSVARLITVFIKRHFPASWSYVWRQGLANLYRPNNQTVVLVLCLGLGTFLIVTLYLLQNTLLKQVSLVGDGDRPNMVLFDVQSDQSEEVLEMVRSLDLPILQRVPIVTMRLKEVQGRTVEEIAEDPNATASRWPLFREYRSTYRDHLIDSEELVSGTWQDRVEDPSSPILVSLEEDIARELDVVLGDPLVFDVQGVPVKTTVGSIRRVDWRRIQTNFFVVFPENILNKAPQFHVIATHVNSAEQSANLQRRIVKRFPNISAIDLTLVLDTVDMVLDKVAFVIRFMSLFSIATGIIVLMGAILSSRFQRAQESVLLRTLGATRAQITRIMAIEYFFLGIFAALTGLTLSVISSWALSYFFFETDFSVELTPLLVALVIVVGMTVFVGMTNSRGLCDSPPLEVLRKIRA